MRFIKLFKDTFKFGIKLVSAFLGTYAVHKFMPEYADPALMVGILYGSFVTAFFLKNSFVTLIWGVNGKPARAPKIKSTPISVREMETYVAAPKPKRTRSTKTETRVAAPKPKRMVYDYTCDLYNTKLKSNTRFVHEWCATRSEFLDLVESKHFMDINDGTLVIKNIKRGNIGREVEA